MKRITRCLAAILLFGSPPAVAQAVKLTLEDFGYPGRWAANCTKPASSENTVLDVAELPYGTFEQRLYFGPGSSDDVFEVLEAARSGKEELTIKIGSGYGLIRTLVIAREGDTIRAVHFIREDGSHIVKDGKVLATNMPAQKLTRCK